VDLQLCLRRYLLGILRAEDAELLDELVFVNDDIASLLCIVEDDLVDAYVSGRLTGKMLRKFESVYLVSPRRRARVAFAAELLRIVER
jgi:hypothetical protein